ncbi:hypothetical protein LWI29_022650 [Acer saccharum]|uniref:ATPase AAA-type core domain-containing protein n=1 Tax=Acer saccharum TaxID=4024 RepID=A0AA39RSI2_ACESA|nr:hypothetical protein LWI29_022650 [Acer saccharum]
MFTKPEADPKTVASIILGGGGGTRLFPLTGRRAKPVAKLSASGDESWKDREADVLALGAIAEDCISVLYPHLSEGLRMDRDVFLLAKENALAIIFIDEVDAITTARFDAQTGAVREVQRILMELLNQMDGFEQIVNVKVIMATNWADTLDPAFVSWKD